MPCQINGCEEPPIMAGTILTEFVLSGLCIDHTNGFKDWLYVHKDEMAEFHRADLQLSRMRTGKFPERFFPTKISVRHNKARATMRELIRKYLMDADRIDMKLSAEAYLNAPED